MDEHRGGGIPKASFILSFFFLPGGSRALNGLFIKISITKLIIYTQILTDSTVGESQVASQCLSFDMTHFLSNNMGQIRAIPTAPASLMTSFEIG